MPADIASEIVIEAPRAHVWKILRDVDRYPEWNPFTPRIESDLTIGSAVILHVAMEPGKPLLRQPEVMSSYVEGEELGWGTTLGLPLFLKANRTQRLIELGPSRCRYQTWDTFSGLLVPVVMGLYRKHVQRGFDETARALKERAEKTA
jgi:hypothetical protein